MDLDRVTTDDVAAAARPVLLVPVGSCEQHGPHLPLDTDTRIAVAVARAVAAGRADVVVAPAVAYGSSGEHQSFAGTLSIGADALTAILVEIGRSALPPEGDGPFAGVVFVNGHGGNLAPVRAAVDRLVAESRAVGAWSPSAAAAGGAEVDAHAGHSETSLLLAIAPDVVGAARPVGNTDPLPHVIDAMRSGGVAAVSANGVLGDARGATPEHGRELLSSFAGDLAVMMATVTDTAWKRS